MEGREGRGPVGRPSGVGSDLVRGWRNRWPSELARRRRFVTTLAEKAWTFWRFDAMVSLRNVQRCTSTKICTEH